MKTRHQPLIVFLLISLFLPRCLAAADATRCELCDGEFGQYYYNKKDKVTGEELMLCGDCARMTTSCFACGLPPIKKTYELSDGRQYCERDYLAAVFEFSDIQELILEAQEVMERHFYGELKMPGENLDVSIVDRVNIESIFALPGNDFSCPNVLGYYRLNENLPESVSHEIYLLAGLTPPATQATFVHELTHAWMAVNIPETRLLASSAKEGFCELVAYLTMRQLKETDQMNNISKNAYTRGQFPLFLEAHTMYGMHQVIRWLQYGTEHFIPSNDIDVVRRVRVPQKQGPDLWKIATTNPPAKTKTDYAELELKGILSGARSKLALINGVSAAEGETVSVPLNGKKVKVLCRSISDSEVVVEFPDDGSTKTLKLKVE